MAWHQLRPLRYLAWLWLAWLLIGNLALNTGLAEALINRKPATFQLHWHRGLSLWPGQAWLWQVHAQGQARQLRWQVQAERVSGRLALLPLFAKRLWLPKIGAHRVRFELDRAEHDRPPSKPRPGGWTVRLGAVASDSVLAARFGDFQLDGRGAAHFGLVHQLHGDVLEVLPSQARMVDARLRRGDEVLAEPLDWQLEFALPRHHRERVPGLAWLGLADARLRVTARSAGLTVALDEDGRWRTSPLPVSALVDDAAGRFEFDLGLSKGVLAPGGRVDVRLPLRADTEDGGHWTGQALLQLAVDEDVALHVVLPPPPGDAGHIDARLLAAGRTLPIRCAPALPGQAGLGPSCEFDRDPGAGLRRVAGDLRLHWHFASLRWFGPLLARLPWLHLDGSGEVDAEVRIEHGQLASGSRLRVPHLNARIDVLDNHIEGEAHADVWVEAGTDDRPQTRLALIVDRFQIASKDAPDQVHARGRELRLDVDARGPLACLLPRHATEHAAKPECDMQPGGPATLHAQLRFEQAEVPELAAYARYLPGEGVRLLGGSGRLSGELHLDGAGEVGHGRLDLAASTARLAIADLELEGDLQLHTKLQRVNLGRHEFELDGTHLRLQRVRALDGARMLGRDWWLDAMIEHGRLHWGQPLIIDASVHAAARDVSLVLDLFARRAHYPRWALRLIDAGRAQLHGRVRLDEAGVRLDPMHAYNERFDVRARLAIRDREPSGDLLLGWGRLQAGLELVGGERRWHLLGAREWFDRDDR